MDLKSAQFWSRRLAAHCPPGTPAIRLMEVCGTHTHAIARHNLRELLPGGIQIWPQGDAQIRVEGAQDT